MRHSGGSPRTVRAAGRWGTQEAARTQSEQQDDEALRRQPAHSQSSRTMGHSGGSPRTVRAAGRIFKSVLCHFCCWQTSRAPLFSRGTKLFLRMREDLGERQTIHEWSKKRKTTAENCWTHVREEEEEEGGRQRGLKSRGPPAH
ncbi:hypothetical protein CesoFtcFv8_009493 [Champsocephalus esox]|uniref:Uncharacterized protein n=1 Tax=Champsocephalus esox TaxID=159716 RepID=A0AAN8H569_9TELE|nr:hypothetical protein CesoFtcFv8_009493 [Champsocephalus esox]